MTRLLPLPFVALLALAACEQAPDLEPEDVDDVEPIGSLAGAFTCQLTEEGVTDVDYGLAHFEGDIEHTAYIAGLRTQGCYARTVEAERGWVVSIRMLQQISFDVAQVLELNLPIGVGSGDDERLLQAGDEVVMSGAGGFGSMYWIDGAGSPAEPLFLRTAGGVVTIDEPDDLGPSDWFAGHFDDLRMGEID